MGFTDSIYNLPLSLGCRVIHVGGIPDEDIRTLYDLKMKCEVLAPFFELATPNNGDNFNLVTFFHLSLRPKLPVENFTVVFYCY